MWLSSNEAPLLPFLNGGGGVNHRQQ